MNEKLLKIWRSKEFQMTIDVLRIMIFVVIIVFIFLLISYAQQIEANPCLLCEEYTGAKCIIAPWQIESSCDLIECDGKEQHKTTCWECKNITKIITETD